METMTLNAGLAERLRAPRVVTRARARMQREATNTSEVLRVLDRASRDDRFIGEVGGNGSEALRSYRLTLPEKAALVSGDVRWLEDHIGKITDGQRTLANCLLQREAW